MERKPTSGKLFKLSAAMKVAATECMRKLVTGGTACYSSWGIKTEKFNKTHTEDELNKYESAIWDNGW